MIVHPRDPYHRIDTFATARQVTVSLDGHVLAESTEVKALCETGLPVRYYFPFRDVRLEHLVAQRHRHPVRLQGHRRPLVGPRRRHRPPRHRPGPTRATRCSATPRPSGAAICFYNERTDIEVDGLPQARPQTPWSR